jgi:hypothetical protein
MCPHSCIGVTDVGVGGKLHEDLFLPGWNRGHKLRLALGHRNGFRLRLRGVLSGLCE